MNDKPGVSADNWSDYSDFLSMTPTVGLAHIIHRQSNTGAPGQSPHNSWVDAETATLFDHGVDWPNIAPSTTNGFGGAGDNAFQKYGSTTKWFWPEDAKGTKVKMFF